MNVKSYTLDCRKPFTFKVGMKFRVFLNTEHEKREYEVLKIDDKGNLILIVRYDNGEVIRPKGFNYKAVSFRYRIENNKIKVNEQD